MKKFVFLLLISLFVVTFASAQDSNKVTQVIESNKITYGQSAYFVAIALNLASDSTSEADCSKAISDANIIKLPEDLATTISCDDFALLCMKAWNLKGGVFYTLTQNKRYAFKEFKSLGLLPISTDPKQSLSGRTALNIISSCIELSQKVVTNE